MKTTPEPRQDPYPRARPGPSPASARDRASGRGERIAAFPEMGCAAEPARHPWAEEASRHVLAWLHGDHRPRLLCSFAGEVLWMNGAAQALPRDGFPFQADGARDPRAPARVPPQLLAETALDEQPRCATHPEFRREPWIIWAQRVHGPDGPVAALTLRPRRERPDLAALAQARQLTPAEKRIIGMMSGGEETADIAAALGISLETLRTHLKHAYRKLGVTSRGELFAALSEFLQP